MRYVKNYKNFVEFKNKPQSSQKNPKFEKKFYNLGKNVSLFDVGLIRESNQTDKLILEQIGSKKLDNIIVKALHKSINLELKGSDSYEIYEGLLGDIVNLGKRAVKAVYDTGKAIGTGIVKIGKAIYKSLADFISDCGNIFKKIWNAACQLFKWIWNTIIKQIPSFLKKIGSSFLSLGKGSIHGLATLVFSSQTESEGEAMKEDVSKIMGFKKKLDEGEIPRVDKEEQEKIAKEKAEEVTDPDMEADGWDEEDEDKNESVSKSHIKYLYQSYKGLVSKHGYMTMDYINELVEQGDYQKINEGDDHKEGTQKKGVVEWVVEIFGFLMSPIVKLRELAIKSGVNGSATILSSFVRGFKNAFKYIKIGAIASLCYHLYVGATKIVKHLLEDHDKSHTDTTDKEHAKEEPKKVLDKEALANKQTKVETPKSQISAQVKQDNTSVVPPIPLIDADKVESSEIHKATENTGKAELETLAAGMTSKLLESVVKVFAPGLYFPMECMLVTFGSLELVHLVVEADYVKNNFSNNALYKTLKVISDNFHKFIVWLPKAICNYFKSGSDAAAETAGNK